MANESMTSAKPFDEMRCVRCGYNLRGLPSDGKCPECGTPIGRSHRGNILAAADSSWLAGLCRGLMLVVAAVGIHIAGIVLGIGGFFGIAELADREEMIEAVHLGVSAVLLFSGVLFLTRLDPRLTLAENPVVLRKVSRGIAAAALFPYILTLSLVPLAPGALQLAGGLEWSLTALFIAAIVSASLYLGRLAERIPDDELASSTRSTARKFAVTMPVVVVSIAIGEGLRQPGAPYLVVRGFFLLLALCFTPFNLYYTFTLFGLWTSSYRKAFRKCLAEAQDRDRAIAEQSVGVGSAQPPLKK